MNSANNGKRVLALGVGGAGCHIIRCLKAIAPDSGLYTAVIDTDSMALKDHPADFQLAATWLLQPEFSSTRWMLLSAMKPMLSLSVRMLSFPAIL